MSSKVTAKKLPIPKPINPPVISLTLELTKADAEDILALTDVIGGHPDESARGVFDQIAEELMKNGIRMPRRKAITSQFEPSEEDDPGIYFTKRDS
jgi:hypothetical protein